MKIRLDFVTNSSSSSFIFGKPSENSITLEDVQVKIDVLKTYFKKMFKFIEDNLPEITDDNLEENKDKLVEFMEEEYNKEHEHNCYPNYELAEDLLRCDRHDNEVRWVDEFDKDLIMIDLRYNENREYTYDELELLDEAMSWYCYEDENLKDKIEQEKSEYPYLEDRDGVVDTGKENTKKLLDFAHKYFGEVLIGRSDIGMYPTYMKDRLESDDSIRYHCGHMG